VNRILLVRLGALGDIVHAIPVAAALRRAHPTAHIDWLVSSKHREILDLVPILDRRLPIRDRGDTDGGTSLIAAVRDLRKQQYDVVIDLQGLIKSALIARSSGARRVVGFTSRYLREPLARLFYTSVHDPGGDGIYATTETRHVVQINLGLLQTLGISTQTVEFPIDEGAENRCAAEVLEHTGGRYVILNPGAAWPNKRWPPERLAEVAVALNRRRGLPSLVIWGPGERELGEEVVARAGGAAVLAPRTSLADIVALARRAALMISGDTGPTHIGAAVGTPIVGLYGPTRPERNGPWLPQDVTVSRAAICQCHHLRRCKLETMCLLDIQVDEVITAAERRLDAAAHV
jgi:lipopolysaccharide heptosyltransferase I